ncbi:hypothetical protein BU16DRAFT_566186 [Lophium mytilinum]|uniref:Uncharacterized protein n=1 Tax=Lophium mytilinum TaxID=390894 RepID=A0A6A6QCK0_9PEZI|nr:hypothetical protein BU16DRAFT_566186 [Lophium mytilinum]
MGAMIFQIPHPQIPLDIFRHLRGMIAVSNIQDLSIRGHLAHNKGSVFRATYVLDVFHALEPTMYDTQNIGRYWIFDRPKHTTLEHWLMHGGQQPQYHSFSTTQEDQQPSSPSDRYTVAMSSDDVMMANADDHMVQHEGERSSARHELQVVGAATSNVIEAGMNYMLLQPAIITNMSNAFQIIRAPLNPISALSQAHSLPRLDSSTVLGKRPRGEEGIQCIIGPGKRVQVLCDGHDIGVTIGFVHDKEIDIFVTSGTQEKQYIKSDPLFRSKNEKMVSFHARASEYKRGEFPFMKMPPELRIMVYKILMAQDSKSDDTYEAIRDPWWNLSRERTRGGAVMSRKNGGFMIPGFLMKSRTWVAGDFQKLYLGSARPLLGLNKKMRVEVGQLVFQTKKFDLTSLTIETTCEWLLDIGEIGRQNIKNLAIEWWSPVWSSGRRDRLIRPLDAAADLVELLASCPHIDYLEVRLPYGNGLGRSRVKPHHFNTYCDLKLLRTVTGPDAVRVESPNPPLTRWLFAGMAGVDEQNVRVRQDKHYHWASN